MNQFDYEIFKNDGIISIFYHSEEFNDFDLLIGTFWQWIIKKEKNEWTIDYYDASQSDCHGQDTGKYSIESYLDLPYDIIKDDLREYLFTIA